MAEAREQSGFGRPGGGDGAGGDTLVLALRRQLQCLVTLGKYAELQHDHIEQDRTEDLIQLLTQRQSVVEELATLEEVIGPARRNWSERAALFDSAQRAWIEGAFVEAKRRLAAVNESDQRDTFILQQRKHLIGGQLGRVGQSQRVTRGYIPAAGGHEAGQLNITE